jgi:hypothetical protein
MKLLEKLVEIRSASGDEGPLKEFILNYVNEVSADWTCQPKIVEGVGFQDCLILVFGEPTTAIYAHMDSIGFTTGYDKELIKIGGPRIIDGMQLVGSDSAGEIDTELMVIETEDGQRSMQ